MKVLSAGLDLPHTALAIAATTDRPAQHPPITYSEVELAMFVNRHKLMLRHYGTCDAISDVMEREKRP
jgi:hypothetical protein